MSKTNLINTDKAWENLYERLKDEQLLPERQPASHLMNFRKIAAVVLLCLLSGVAVYLLTNNRQENLLSKTNNDARSTLVTTLQDGSVVYLNSKTSLYYPESFTGKERRVRIEGDALFDISKEPQRPFYIETGPVVVKVLGTTFRIRTSGNESSFQLSVDQGTVEVTEKNSGNALRVQTGEMVSLESGTLKRSAAGLSQPDFTGRMRFKDERLDNILKVINHVSGIPISISDKALGDETLTVTFNNDSVDHMIDLICVAMNLKCTKKENIISIDRP